MLNVRHGYRNPLGENFLSKTFCLVYENSRVRHFHGVLYLASTICAAATTSYFSFCEHENWMVTIL